MSPTSASASTEKLPLETQVELLTADLYRSQKAVKAGYRRAQHEKARMRHLLRRVEHHILSGEPLIAAQLVRDELRD